MNQRTRRWLDWLLLAAVICFAIVLAVDSRREHARQNFAGQSVLILASPVLKATDSLRGKIQGLVYNEYEGERIRAENDDLKRQVAGLKLELAHTADTLTRLEHLTGVEAKTLGERYRLILAEIIGRGRESLSGGLLISRGESDGLEPGLPVVHGDALVGVVRETQKNTAFVQILTDPNSLVACVIEKTRESGIARGLGQKINRLEFLPDVQASTLPRGAALITGGLTGSLFPGGLRIGSIELSEPNDYGERVGIVAMAVDVSAIEEVVILAPIRESVQPLTLFSIPTPTDDKKQTSVLAPPVIKEAPAPRSDKATTKTVSSRIPPARIKSAMRPTPTARPSGAAPTKSVFAPPSAPTPRFETPQASAPRVPTPPLPPGARANFAQEKAAPRRNVEVTSAGLSIAR